VEPPQPRQFLSTISLALDINDEANMNVPLPNVNVQLCPNSQTRDCSNPLTPPVQTDANGTASFQFAWPVGGPVVAYARLTPSSTTTIFPEDFYWGFALSEPHVELTFNGASHPFGVYALSGTEFDNLAKSLGVTQDPSRGVVYISPRDCRGYQAPGVAIEISSADGATMRFYNVTKTGTEADSAGGAAFFNVPSGSADVTITPVALGKPAAKVSVSVNKGVLDTVAAMPGNPGM
jgi:hypothetical protein